MARLDPYDQVKQYPGGKQEQKPVISATTASCLSALFVALYVVPFYLSTKTRPSPSLNRDAPSVIRARIQTVTVTITASLLITLYVVHIYGKYTLASSLHLLGLFPINPFDILQSLVLTFILFLAPLYERIVVDRDLSPASSIAGRVKVTLASSQGYRNYIAGPLTEELLFRSTIVTLHLLAHISARKIILLTPLYFGIAHLHHLYEFRLTHSDTPVVTAVLRSLFQFGFTTVFGWYTAFIYVRTANLYSVFLIHVFCNCMGFPRFWGKVQPRDELSFSSINIRGKEDIDHDRGSTSAQSAILRYTVIYYVLLVGGAYGFYGTLFSLTNSSAALAIFE